MEEGVELGIIGKGTGGAICGLEGGTAIGEGVGADMALETEAETVDDTDETVAGGCERFSSSGGRVASTREHSRMGGLVDIGGLEGGFAGAIS